jgi:hypothetical protein
MLHRYHTPMRPTCAAYTIVTMLPGPRGPGRLARAHPGHDQDVEPARLELLRTTPLPLARTAATLSSPYPALSPSPAPARHSCRSCDARRCGSAAPHLYLASAPQPLPPAARHIHRRPLPPRRLRSKGVAEGPACIAQESNADAQHMRSAQGPPDAHGNSSGSLSPFSVLHRSQSSCRLWGTVFPPFEYGTMWSPLASSKLVNFLPHLAKTKTRRGCGHAHAVQVVGLCSLVVVPASGQ